MDSKRPPRSSAPSRWSSKTSSCSKPAPPNSCATLTCVPSSTASLRLCPSLGLSAPATPSTRFTLASAATCSVRSRSTPSPPNSPPPPDRSHSNEAVIPTEASDGFIVRCAVEGPPHFAPLLFPVLLLRPRRLLQPVAQRLAQSIH